MDEFRILGWGREKEDLNGKKLGEIFYIRINNGQVKALGRTDFIKAIKLNLPESGEYDEFSPPDSRAVSRAINGNRDAMS